MKTICIAGRVTRDAELRRTQNGDAVLGFSVAVDDFNGKEKRGLFFDCSLWGQRATSLEPHITKGTPVTVSGDLSTREYDGKTYLTIRANDVTLQGGKKQDSGQSQQAPSYAAASGGSASLDDEIPFAMEWR